MDKQTMGALIAEKRKAQGMTQRDLAERLGVTDKAVSKWERDLSCPDISAISKLAQVLGITVEELLAGQGHPAKEAPNVVDTVLKAVPLAMGVAVTVLSLLGNLDVNSGFGLLGIGVACLALQQFRNCEQ